MKTLYQIMVECQKELQDYDKEHFPSDKKCSKKDLDKWEKGRAPLLKKVNVAITNWSKSRTRSKSVFNLSEDYDNEDSDED